MLRIFLISFLLASLSFGKDLRYSWGFSGDLENYGGGLSAFTQIASGHKFKVDMEASWIMVQDGSGIYAYNYYTEQYVLMNPQHLSFIKVVSEFSFFPWTQSMYETFNFGFFVGAGPILSLNTEENLGLVERWKNVEKSQSLYMRCGVQALIKRNSNGFYRLKFGYDHVSFDSIIDYRREYNGLFLQFGVEFPF